MFFEVKNLAVHYGEAQVIHDFSLKMDEGEVVAVVGANGAGKTTVLRAISGLKKPTSGEVWFEGRRIDTMPGYAIPKLGISQVPADRMAVTTMSVLDNLKLGAHMRRDRQQIAEDVEEMYETFPILKEKAQQAAGNLSGGQQQMLVVARALMARPKLLLMDEPSVGLSPLMVTEVGKQITDISRRRGVSILLVEQNARLALRLSDRAYVMALGRVVLEGDSDEVAADERVKRHYLGG